MSDSTTPVILSAVRTPIGRYLGGLSGFTAPQLGAMVIREAVARAGVDAGAVDEVIMGQVVQGGSGQAPARQALIHAGLPPPIAALTINKVCGSGLKAVMLASQAIKAGDAEVIVAGGQESMSSAPHYVYGMRNGDQGRQPDDGRRHDPRRTLGSFGCCHMGEYAEYTAEKAGVSREDQDAFAYDSHRKAVAATEAGKFKAEILPVQVPGRADPRRSQRTSRPGRTPAPQTLAKLKPAFRQGRRAPSPRATLRGSTTARARLSSPRWHTPRRTGSSRWRRSPAMRPAAASRTRSSSRRCSRSET